MIIAEEIIDLIASSHIASQIERFQTWRIERLGICLLKVVNSIVYRYRKLVTVRALIIMWAVSARAYRKNIVINKSGDIVHGK